MRTFNIDFIYFHEAFGEDVVVEAEAMLYKAVPNPTSDWDAKDHLEVVSTEVYHKGDVVDIDIPLQVIYSEILAKIRDAEMVIAFSEEDGGF